VPVLLYKLYGARTILNTIIQSLTPHNSMLNMSLVRHSVTHLHVPTVLGFDYILYIMYILPQSKLQSHNNLFQLVVLSRTLIADLLF